MDIDTLRNRLSIAVPILVVLGLALLQLEMLNDMRRSEHARIRGELVAGAYLVGQRIDELLASYETHFDVAGISTDRRLAAAEQAWRNRDMLTHPRALDCLLIAHEGKVVALAEGVSAAGALPLDLDLSVQRAIAEPPGLVLPTDDGDTIVLLLDQDRLFDEVIAELVDELLLERPDAKGLRVLISETLDTGTIRYRSAPSLTTDDLTDPDVTMPFFRLPREPAELGEGRFLIRVRHGAGSIERAVGSMFTRYLIMTMGTLAVLVVGIAMLIANARRARALANRQMTFVTTVSHELRTPLAVICSAGENLAQGRVRDEERVSRYGNVILEEGRRLSRLIDNVLRFSAIRAGQASYAREPVDPVALMEEVIGDTAALSRDREARLERDWSDELPVLIADRGALRVALGNLVANAAKHGGKAPTIRLWIKEITVNGKPGLELGVGDDGPGIPKGELTHLLRPFYRGEAAREAQIEGSGLGLTIAKDVVAGHGGTIGIESEPEQGTRVRLLLPLRPKGVS